MVTRQPVSVSYPPHAQLGHHGQQALQAQGSRDGQDKVHARSRISPQACARPHENRHSRARTRVRARTLSAARLGQHHAGVRPPHPQHPYLEVVALARFEDGQDVLGTVVCSRQRRTEWAERRPRPSALLLFKVDPVQQQPSPGGCT